MMTQSDEEREQQQQHQVAASVRGTPRRLMRSTSGLQM